MEKTYTAFAGDLWLACGNEQEIRSAILAMPAGEETPMILVFNDRNGQQIDIDMREGAGTEDAPSRGRGRPKLGVKSKEVTLLPRHWQWLAEQSGGASVTLRGLVEQARKSEDHSKVTARQASDATYSFMTAIAGDKPGYEEAVRALYAKDAVKFAAQIAAWPVAIRDHAASLAGSVFI